MEYANKNPNGYRFTTGPDGKPVLQSVSGYQRYTTPEGRLKSPGSNEYVITAVGELVEKTIVPVDKVFDLLKKKWETAGSASGLDPGSFRDCKVKFLKDYAGANGTDLEKIQELLLEVKRKQQVKADKSMYIPLSWNPLLHFESRRRRFEHPVLREGFWMLRLRAPHSFRYCRDRC